MTLSLSLGASGGVRVRMTQHSTQMPVRTLARTRHAAPPGNSPYPKWCLPGRVPLTRPASLSLSPIETLRYPMTGSSTDHGRLAGRSGEAECRIDAGRVVVPAAIRAIAIVPVVPCHTLAVSHTGVVIADSA